jgi:hypothetical protein
MRLLRVADEVQRLRLGRTQPQTLHLLPALVSDRNEMRPSRDNVQPRDSAWETRANTAERVGKWLIGEARTVKLQIPARHGGRAVWPIPEQEQAAYDETQWRLAYLGLSVGAVACIALSFLVAPEAAMPDDLWSIISVVLLHALVALTVVPICPWPCEVPAGGHEKSPRVASESPHLASVVSVGS